MRFLFKKSSQDSKGILPAPGKDWEYNYSGESSTLDVSIPKIIIVKADSAAKKKRVQFSMTVEASKVAANSDCLKVCWLTANDMAQAKSDLDVLVQGLGEKREERYFIKAIDEIYETCCAVHEETLDQLDLLGPLEEHALIEGVRDCQTFGLLGTMVEKLELDYISRRKQMKRSIRQVQNSLPACELRAETIRKNLENLTRPSRLLAREMGKATEAAVGRF